MTTILTLVLLVVSVTLLQWQVCRLRRAIPETKAPPANAQQESEAFIDAEHRRIRDNIHRGLTSENPAVRAAAAKYRERLSILWDEP